MNFDINTLDFSNVRIRELDYEHITSRVNYAVCVYFEVYGYELEYHYYRYKDATSNYTYYENDANIQAVQKLDKKEKQVLFHTIYEQFEKVIERLFNHPDIRFQVLAYKNKIT